MARSSAVAALLLAGLRVAPAWAASAPDAVEALGRSEAAAEGALRAGRSPEAEALYARVLFEGWRLLGSLEQLDGRLPEARAAFRAAAAFAGGAPPAAEPSPLARLEGAPRPALKARVRQTLARAYLNLGVLKTQAKQSARAAPLLEKAVELGPELSEAWPALGVACFNAGEYQRAIAPLTRALNAKPSDAALKRMLAMAHLNTGGYVRAAELLRDDPELAADASLQFAYGLALVRSDHAPEAEAVFARLLREHGDSAELSVLLGQASAQQGDFDGAIEALRRALALKADVAEANGTLGEIYLKQGKLAEAEQALRAELKRQPDDLKSRQNLAAVLDMQQRGDEALTLLRGIVKAAPDSADARYLLGKILLAQGAAEDAVAELEKAAALAPEDARVQYQLGRAYQKLGRPEEARRRFEQFQQLKDKRRERAP
jgi:Flp pilus assembly protein TadD